MPGERPSRGEEAGGGRREGGQASREAEQWSEEEILPAEYTTM